MCKLGAVYQKLLDAPQPSESWFVVCTAEMFASVIATESENDQATLRQLWEEHTRENEAERKDIGPEGREKMQKSREVSVRELISTNFERLQDLLYGKCGISVSCFPPFLSIGETWGSHSNLQLFSADGCFENAQF